MFDFYHVYGGYNPFDFISNYWSYTKIWVLFHPLLFYMVDTMDFMDLGSNRGGGQGKEG